MTEPITEHTGALTTIAYDHLYRLSDGVGLFEHADRTVPRPEHGYCVDDVARGLLVAVREPEPSGQLLDLAKLYLNFVLAAEDGSGRVHNRGEPTHWIDEAGVADCWGRALWGLGTAVARAPALAAEAMIGFDRAAALRSPWSRATAFAALGAAEVLSVAADHAEARRLLADAATAIGSPSAAGAWPWPEPRLRYANAALAEVLLAAGSLLGDAAAARNGLTLLSWLVDIESHQGNVSVTPVGGWAAGEARPGYDQQPIEVAALADACARAFDVTGDERWRSVVLDCADWFRGANDAGISLLDPVSGGGCDGLEPRGRNENQGAESTLALLSTMQQARRLGG